MALAPSRRLFGDPSNEMSSPSRAAIEANVRFATALRITLRTFSTAFRQPRPAYRVLDPSRISNASAEPFEAPDGTDAVTSGPSSTRQYTRTVGRHRLSRISSASNSTIFPIPHPYAFPPIVAMYAPTNSLQVRGGSFIRRIVALRWRARSA